MLDIRTVLFSSVVTNAICALVMASLWRQSRRRSAGTGYWLADFALQFLSILLIALRGLVPDFLSVLLGVPFILAGSLLMLIGLSRFVGKSVPARLNLVLLAAFAAAHAFLTYGQPSLRLRNVNLSLGLLAFCAQCSWLLLRGVDARARRETRAVGLMYAAYCLVSLLRAAGDLAFPRGDDLFRSGLFDTLVIQAYQILIMGTTFSLFLMVNGRIFTVMQEDMEKRTRAEDEIRSLNVELERRVAERTAELSDLYENSPCGYHSLDARGVIVRINETELGWLGYAREEIVGKRKIVELFTPASVALFQRNFPGFKERGWVRDLEFEMIRKDGTILPILLSGAAIYDSEGRYASSRSTMIDNTNRKEAELRMEAALEAMRASQTRLEATNKELEAFAYSVSHDLRTPLRAIDGFSRILLEEYAEGFDAEGRRLIGLVCSNVKRMDKLITDLLALSRVTLTGLSYSLVDMGALARAAFAEVATGELRERFDFAVADLPEAPGDPALLRQVWVNLLSNAVKYTRSRDLRRIEVGGDRRGDELVYFVRDTGVGFDPAYSNKLFGIFERLHKPEEFEGTGVGLAIVERIVHRHRGRAWGEGRVGEGACFYFTLPRDGASEEASRKPRSATA